jgi:hypothetical protein
MRFSRALARARKGIDYHVGRSLTAQPRRKGPDSAERLQEFFLAPGREQCRSNANDFFDSIDQELP